MNEFLSTLQTTLSNYSFNLTALSTSTKNEIYLTKKQKDILNKFSSYPSSKIKDVIVTKLVYEISIQGQLFKKLTTSSLGISTNLTKSMNFIINKFEKSKIEDLLNNNDDIRIWIDSEVLLSEVMKKCNQMKNEYSDITNNLNKIQDSLQERKIMTHIDSFITLISTVFAGRILGALYEKNDDKQTSDKIRAINLLSKEDQKYINSVIVDIKEIRKSVGLFENYWLNQFNSIDNTRSLIVTNIINNKDYKFSIHSILKSWIQAKKYFENYQATVDNLH